MSGVTTVVFPVFALIALGYVLAWSRLLTPDTGAALSSFAFIVAIPALIFRTIATADVFGVSPWRVWFSYFSAMALAWIAGTLLMRIVFARDARAGVVGGFSAGYGNNVLLGIPLVISAFGEHGGIAIFLVVAVHLPITMLVSTILIERALKTDGINTAGGFTTVLGSVARNVALNPIAISVVMSLAWRVVGLALPELAQVLVGRLGDVAGTLALLSVGMSLRKHSVVRHVLPAVALSAVKLLLMPAIALIITFWLIQLPPIWGSVLVLTAACPTGVYASLIADRFQTGQALASGTITISTAAGVFTVSFWLAVLLSF